MTFKEHCQKWSNGCGSVQCQYADLKCFARGKLPADIVFVGEAPGYSENATGIVMVGPAGHLMDQIIDRAVPPDIRWVICNLVVCIPLDPEDFQQKLDKPTDEQVDACAPRLVEFIEIAQPKLIICVGTVSRDWLDSKYRGHIKLPIMENGQPIPQEWVYHPSYMLKRTSETNMLVNQAVIRVRTAVEEHLLGIPQD